jgi:GNAT superfamily N-acetyltransferase
VSLVEAVERHQTELAVRWARLQGGEVYRDDGLVVTIVGLPVSFTNNVHRTRLTPENVERRVAETTALLRDRGVPALWWVSPLDTPEDLGETLERSGFDRAEEMPWMAADLSTIPDASLPEGVEAFRADGPERFAQFVEAMMRGFGPDPQVARALTALREAVGAGEEAEWQPFVAVRDGEVVGSSGFQRGGGIAGIYNVATPEEHRGRGIGAGMTAVAMRWARDHGFDTAVLGSSPLAVPLYERLGFRHVCSMGVYVLKEPVE